jgi:hypothetical protein
MRGIPGAIAVVGALGLLVASACAGPIAKVDGGYRHRSLDYSIGRPEGPGWERVAVKGADLTFRGPGGAAMSLQSRCGRPVATAELMARHLVIGFRERALVAATPVAIDGRSGWSQSFDTRGKGGAARVKTVTLVAGSCSFDWVLVTHAAEPAAEAAFDAWWGGFRLDPQRWAQVPR